MSIDIITQLVWGLRRDALPPGCDPDAAGLQEFDAGDVEEEYDKYVGLEVCAEVRSLSDAYQDSSVEYDELARVRAEVAAKLEAAGVSEPPVLFMLQSVD